MRNNNLLPRPLITQYSDLFTYQGLEVTYASRSHFSSEKCIYDSSRRPQKKPWLVKIMSLKKSQHQIWNMPWNVYDHIEFCFGCTYCQFLVKITYVCFQFTVFLLYQWNINTLNKAHQSTHNDAKTWKRFQPPVFGDTHAHSWFSSQRANNAEHRCYQCSLLEQRLLKTVELQCFETPYR